MNSLSEAVAVVAVIDPDARAPGTIATSWLSMANYQSLMAVIMAGDLGVNAAIDAKLQQARDASGTGVKDVAGKAIMQLHQAGTDSSRKQAVINLRADELDRNGGYTHVRLAMTTAVATSDTGALVLAASPRYGAAPATTVAEIVA